ncbi:MAG TPA: hypothetical protein VK302_00155 [Terriglobales bacterium]|nr:hypothetical protein [Terriglobales bacterium]
MPNKICPVCREPYIKKEEFTVVITYYHAPPKPNCEQRLGLPGNHNKVESTQPDVGRRKSARRGKK